MSAKGFEEGAEDERAAGTVATARKAARAIERLDERRNLAGLHQVDGKTMDDDELEKFIENRYAHMHHKDGGLGRGKNLRTNQHAGMVTSSHLKYKEQARNPTVGDPNLWVVKCKAGCEREAVVCLMQKFIEKQNSSSPLQIKSVVAQDHLKGYLYIEAFKEAHVRTAIEGLNIIYKRDVEIVPLQDRVDVMTVNKKAEMVLKPGAFVRVKNGTYKGDLALVDAVDNQISRVVIKLLPRIDYEYEVNKVKRQMKIDDDEDDDLDDDDRRKKRGRAPQKVFKRDDARNFGLIVEEEEDRHTRQIRVRMSGHLFVEGYLLKTVNMKSLMLDANPSVEELKSFNAAKSARDDAYGDELENMARVATASKKVHFSRGDFVVVIAGDLMNLQATVEKVAGDMLELRPKMEVEGVENATVKVKAMEVRKWFKTGNKVKVIEGKHSGETGIVIKVDMVTQVCTILSDISKQEIEAFSSDLAQHASGSFAGQEALGNYRLGDLVALEDPVFGVIIKVERDACQVLTNGSTPEKAVVKVARLPDIRRRIITKSLQAQDSQLSPISVNDMVGIVVGPGKGRRGLVKHVYRGVLFIHCKDLVEHAAYIVTRSKNCAVAGGTMSFSQRGPGLDPSMTPSHAMMSPYIGLQSPGRMQSPHHAQQQLMQSPGQRAETNRVATFSRSRKDQFLHQEVSITFGKWKGYKGRCVGSDEYNARIEIVAQENRRIVVLPKEKVFKEYRSPATGRDEPSNPYLSGMAAPFRDVTRTPAHAPGAYPFTPVHQPSSMPTPQRMATPVHTSYNPPAYNNAPRMYDVNTSAISSGQTQTPNKPGEADTPVSGLMPTHIGHMMSNARTPGDEYNVRTAGTGNAFTPADGTGFTPSDYSPYSDYSPSSGAMTPYMQVQTPGTTLSEPGTEPNRSSSLLLMYVNLLVRLKADATKEFKVVSATPEEGKLHLENIADPADRCTVVFSVDTVTLVKPNQNAVKDSRRVRVISGAEAGMEGSIIAVDEDENEAIVAIDGEEKMGQDIKVCSLDLVGLLVA